MFKSLQKGKSGIPNQHSWLAEIGGRFFVKIGGGRRSAYRWFATILKQFS